MFKQLGGLLPRGFPPLVLDTIRTDKVFRYRSKITPHYDVPAPNKALKRAQGRGNAATTSSTACKIGPIGFKKKASRQLMDVLNCHIATLEINNALCHAHKKQQEEARQVVAEEAWQGWDAPAEDSDGAVETNHAKCVNPKAKGLVFKFQAGNFFQNNPHMLDLTVDLVVDAAMGASSPPTGQ